MERLEIENTVAAMKNAFDGFASLSFCSIIFHMNGWLIRGSNTNEEECDRFLGCVCFLEQGFLLSGFKASSGSKGRCGLPGLSGPQFTQSYIRHARLVLTLNPAEFQRRTQPLDSGLTGCCQWLCVSGQ